MTAMYNIIIFLLGSLTVLIQSQYAYNIAIFNLKPNFILLFVIIISMREKFHTALIFAFVFGLMEDAFSIGGFGMNAIAKIFVVFIAAVIRDKFYRDDLVTQTATVFITGLFKYFVIFIISNLFFFSFENAPNISFSHLIAIIYTALLAPPVFFIYNAFLDMAKRMFVREEAISRKF